MKILKSNLQTTIKVLIQILCKHMYNNHIQHAILIKTLKVVNF